MNKIILKRDKVKSLLQREGKKEVHLMIELDLTITSYLRRIRLNSWTKESQIALVSTLSNMTGRSLTINDLFIEGRSV